MNHSRFLAFSKKSVKDAYAVWISIENKRKWPKRLIGATYYSKRNFMLNQNLMCVKEIEYDILQKLTIAWIFLRLIVAWNFAYFKVAYWLRLLRLCWSEIKASADSFWFITMIYTFGFPVSFRRNFQWKIFPKNFYCTIRFVLKLFAYLVPIAFQGRKTLVCLKIGRNLRNC